MKVIKYGEGYEPKRVICKHCKSEIEYFDDELSEFHYIVDKNGKTLYHVGKLKDWGAALTGLDMTCPACYHRMTIETQLYPVWKKKKPSDADFKLLIAKMDLQSII